jgi:hypothetical protein
MPLRLLRAEKKLAKYATKLDDSPYSGIRNRLHTFFLSCLKLTDFFLPH